MALSNDVRLREQTVAEVVVGKAFPLDPYCLPPPEVLIAAVASPCPPGSAVRQLLLGLRRDRVAYVQAVPLRTSRRRRAYRNRQIRLAPRSWAKMDAAEQTLAWPSANTRQARPRFRPSAK